jgi:hypothetical protein
LGIEEFEKFKEEKNECKEKRTVAIGAVGLHGMFERKKVGGREKEQGIAV